MNRALKKLGIIIILGTTIFMIGCSKTDNTKNDGNTSIQQENKIELDKGNAINISSDNDFSNILDEFSKNEIKAKNDYLNKTVKIAGNVKSIKNDDNGNILVHISTDDNLYGANLYFENTKENQERIMNLKVSDKDVKGDIIIAYGYFETYKDSKSLADGQRINITHCEFAE